MVEMSLTSKYRVLDTAIGARIDTIERGHKGDTRPLSRPLTWISLGLGVANFLLVAFPYEGNRGDGNKR